MTKNQKLAVWALVAVAVGYAFLNVSIRLMDAGFEPFTQTYLRLLFGALLGLLIFRKCLRLDVIKTTSAKDWLVLFLMGTVGYSAGVLFVTLGALNTELVNVSVLTSTIPFFAAIYTFAIWRKGVSKKLLLFLALSFVGAAMVATKTFPPLLSSVGVGEVFVLVAAAAFAWYAVGRRLLSDKLNNYEIAVVTMFIAAASSLTVALIAGETLNPMAFLDPLVLVGLAIGIGFNIVASLFENFAFQHISPVIGNQLILIENAIAPVFGFLLYAEVIGLYETVGAVLIVGSVALSARLVGDHS